ncbi:MAG: hypothetical protein LBS12_01035 [Prevotellaceae bacterium]|jgi:hypothetical protein|nr:hypothetical protein [Prevotellaceae bacterium]
MKTRYYLPIIAALLAFMPASLYAQTDAFERYKQEQARKFDEYKQNRQREFAEYIKQKWTAYEVYKGIKKPVKPQPVEPPVADPDADIPDAELPTLPDVVAPPEETPPDGTPAAPEEPPRPPADTRHEKTTVNVLGHTLEIEYDKAFRVSLPSVSEEEAGNFWAALAEANYPELVNQCQLIKKAYALNDWGYYVMIKEIADKIYLPSQSGEKRIFTAFILDCSHYKVRLATETAKNELILLLAIDDEVYDVAYITLAGDRYYLVENPAVSAMSTYPGDEKSGARQGFRLANTEALNAASTGDKRTFESRTFDHRLEIVYNPHAIAFYNRMPVTHLSVYFNSACSRDVCESITGAFTPLLQGQSDQEKVASLLRFMHESFPYKTDDQQFGREKFFFYEELFSYPYSDCEDNSVLFAYLVRKLTGLKVVGLEYDDHVAVAVCFRDETPGSYVVCDGDKYTICDPTYFGAQIGQCMPDYLNKSARIIAVN